MNMKCLPVPDGYPDGIDLHETVTLRAAARGSDWAELPGVQVAASRRSRNLVISWLSFARNMKTGGDMNRFSRPWLIAMVVCVLAGMGLGWLLTATTSASADGLTNTDDVPRIIPYEGVLEFDGQAYTTNDGDPLLIEFALFDGEDAEDPVYTQRIEVHVYGGRFTVGIGPVDDEGVQIGDVIAAADDLFVGLTLIGSPDDPDDDIHLASRQRIHATPYSLWTATASNFSVGGTIDMNGNRIANLGLPTGDHDAVSKAHLEALLTNVVVFATGDACPPGFTYYATLEGRFPRGIASGNQAVGGINQLRLWAQIQQASGGGWAKTGPVAIEAGLNGVGQGAHWSHSQGDVQGGWTNRTSAFVDITPPFVNLRPCRFDPASH